MSQTKQSDIQRFLDIKIHREQVDYQILESVEGNGFQRHLIRYQGSEDDEIRAYLFIPNRQKINGAILVHHQHNSERHLGKSEVAGLVGDPLQAFCPKLAQRGIVSLAPDSICFEDRRSNKKGIEPDDDPDDDMLQHYNEMCYRLLRGTTLMKKVIEDSSIGISLLLGLDQVASDKIGILGHSYGGNTVLFHSPFDERIKYSCSSGAVCSYKTKFKFGTGIEMAEVIPGFTAKYDVEDLLKLVAPRPFLIVSSDLDQFSRQAEGVYLAVKPSYQGLGAPSALVHGQFLGEHALDEERFHFIINWFKKKFSE